MEVVCMSHVPHIFLLFNCCCLPNSSLCSIAWVPQVGTPIQSLHASSCHMVNHLILPCGLSYDTFLGVNFTDTSPSSESRIYFHVAFTFVNLCCCSCHAMLPCYFHQI